MRHDRFEGDEALDELRGPRPMTIFLAVVVAGALGVGLRYLVDAAVTARAGDGFPWSTLVVNTTGAFALGVLVMVLARNGVGSDLLRPAIGIGLLGGFTTFSAFALEVVTLAQEGMLTRAVLYVASSNALGIGAAIAGLGVGRLLTP